MQIGFGAPVAGAWATPGNLASFAARAEQAGYASLWTFQRLMVPEGSAMDPVYHSVLDPMVALGYTAAVTSRIRLGVAVLNVPYVSPPFGGEFCSVPAARAAPKPVQRPGPPVILGGIVPRALERVGRLADGWVTSSRTDLSRIGEGIAVIREAAGKAGRDPSAIRVICRGVVHAGTPLVVPEGGGRVLLSGSYDDIRADTEWLSEQGVTEIFYDLNWDPLVGSPAADPLGAAARASEILDALAPLR